MYLWFFVLLIPLYLIICTKLVFQFTKRQRKFKLTRVVPFAVLVLLISSAISYSSEVVTQKGINRVSEHADAVLVTPIANTMRTTVYSLISDDQLVGIAAFTKIPYLPLYEKEFVLLDTHEEPFGFTSDSYARQIYRFGLEDNLLTSYPLRTNYLFYFYALLSALGAVSLFRINRNSA